VFSVVREYQFDMLVCSVTFVSHSVDFYTNSGSAVTNIVRKVYPFWVVLFYFQIRTCSRYITTKNHFKQYFSYIVVVSFIGGGSRSTRRKSPTCRKSFTDFIT
jgi:hypothetical protein